MGSKIGRYVELTGNANPYGTRNIGFRDMMNAHRLYNGVFISDCALKSL